MNKLIVFIVTIVAILIIYTYNPKRSRHESYNSDSSSFTISLPVQYPTVPCPSYMSGQCMYDCVEDDEGKYACGPPQV